MSQISFFAKLGSKFSKLAVSVASESQGTRWFGVNVFF